MINYQDSNNYNDELKVSACPFPPPLGLHPLHTLEIHSNAHSAFENNKTGTPSPPHHSSNILTVKLIFQFLLRDIWLTEQRCHQQPSLGRQSGAGGGRKENIGQNTEEDKEGEERETKAGNSEKERLKQGSKGSQRRPVMFNFITATCSFPNVYFPEALQYKWTEVGVFSWAPAIAYVLHRHYSS